MFQARQKDTMLRAFFRFLRLIFDCAVRSVRKTHGNAVIGLLLNILQAILMILFFYLMLNMVSVGPAMAKIRGDYVLFLMSGVFMFMTHTKAMAAVIACEGPTSPMMNHAPMNPIVSITSAALSCLYLQLFSNGIVLYLYHAMFTPITIDKPIGAFCMILLSWSSGIGVGMLFWAAKPWVPDFIGIISMVYMRANMVASGKMFVANMTPGFVLQWFTWNPLFHTIDQARGFIFLNYHPHYSSLTYPLYISLSFIVIGFMGEHYTRLYMSASWLSKR